MERDFVRETAYSERDAPFEYTEKNVALLRQMADSALEPGLITHDDSYADDYVDALLPGLRRPLPRGQTLAEARASAAHALSILEGLALPGFVEENFGAELLVQHTATGYIFDQDVLLEALNELGEYSLARNLKDALGEHTF